MFFVPGRLARARGGLRSGRLYPLDAEDPYLSALKLFLVFGPLLGFAVVELILLQRDKRRAATAPGKRG